jgi:SNF2 family DNA or RNA helicase
MRYTAHEYQKFAQRFIEENPVSAVFLDCGLGKTVITLTAIQNLMHDSFEVQRVLVIAPLRVARNTWTSEIEKWDHLGDLKAEVAVGSAKERTEALSRKADIVIINRENVQWLIEQSGLPFDFDMVVIDELSSFKSRSARRFRALLSVRPKVKRIVGLTGTPASNSLMDIWAEFRILDLGKRLGRFITSYRNDFFLPDKRNAQMVFSYKPKDGADEEIYRRIADITISMKSTDYLKMPALISCEAKAFMSEDETQAYQMLSHDLVLELPDGKITSANAAVLSGKLSQLANGAIYTDDGKATILHDRKLDVLEDIIEAANGKSVLVAYWFHHDLERILPRLARMGLSYRKLDSTESINAWNNGEVSVGLIHPASAGHGLNLQSGGSHLVWFGLTWSLELYQQTNARLWRQGQTSETVVIQHIVTEGTIDNRILKALAKKEQTQDALLEAVKAEVGR